MSAQSEDKKKAELYTMLTAFRSFDLSKKHIEAIGDLIDTKIRLEVKGLKTAYNTVIGILLALLTAMLAVYFKK